VISPEKLGSTVRACAEPNDTPRDNNASLSIEPPASRPAVTPAAGRHPDETGRS